MLLLLLDILPGITTLHHVVSTLDTGRICKPRKNENELDELGDLEHVRG